MWRLWLGSVEWNPYMLLLLGERGLEGGRGWLLVLVSGGTSIASGHGVYGYRERLLGWWWLVKGSRLIRRRGSNALVQADVVIELRWKRSRLRWIMKRQTLKLKRGWIIRRRWGWGHVGGMCSTHHTRGCWLLHHSSRGKRSSNAIATKLLLENLLLLSDEQHPLLLSLSLKLLLVLGPLRLERLKSMLLKRLLKVDLLLLLLSKEG